MVNGNFFRCRFCVFAILPQTFADIHANRFGNYFAVKRRLGCLLIIDDYVEFIVRFDAYPGTFDIANGFGNTRQPTLPPD